MSANSEQILREALTLSPEERAGLVEQLLATLQSPPDPRIDQLWAREAENRLDAYERGELEEIPAADVLNSSKQRRSK